MKPLIAFAFVLCLTPAAFGQESVMERLARMEANTNSINAMLARQGADIANIKDDLKEIREKLDAVVKATGGTFTASTIDEWGRGKAASLSTKTVQSSMMMQSYGGGYSMGGRRFTPVRGVLRSVGVCKN